MKKWFACLAVAGLLFSAGVGVSHAESWYPLNTDADGRTGYIDNDTVEKDDAQAKLNLKIVDPSGDHSIYNVAIQSCCKNSKIAGDESIQSSRLYDWWPNIRQYRHTNTRRQ